MSPSDAETAPSSPSETPSEPGLEQRLKRLERILSALEADELELEKALELFEEGVGHVRAAERVLAETELRVEELLGDGESTRPLDGGDA